MQTTEIVSKPIPVAFEDVHWARSESARTRRPMIELLEERLGDGPESFVARLCGALNMAAISLGDMLALAPSFESVSYAEASKRECVMLKSEQGDLQLIVANPYDPDFLAWAEERIPSTFDLRLAHRLDVIAYLAKQEESLRAMDQALLDASAGAVARGEFEDLSLQSISESASPVVRFVNSTLYDGLKVNASDIHLETVANGLVIKYRIDGVLTTAGMIQGIEFAEQAISRIKVMAELDIAERRIPQDGRFKVGNKGLDVDFRVSIMPSIHGEDAVLRILDKRSLSDQLPGLRLDHLGFNEQIIMQLRRLAAEPYGMVLVTGPTGSGKTTTLYAVISEVNRGLDKIVTIEDPVEYQLQGVLQIPVNEKKGLTFARGLRSILRHDPDKIMVGEIRDPETAEIAVQSALTGHLVYTTAHANNVFDVIGRFMHMRIDPFNFVSSLNSVMAQRLVRVSCPHCIREDRPSPELLAISMLGAEATGSYRFMRSEGCGQCRGVGYKGRKAIAELLILNDEIRELIVSREPIRKLKAAAQMSGIRFLREAALDLVRNGETTLEEINRVTFVA